MTRAENYAVKYVAPLLMCAVMLAQASPTEQDLDRVVESLYSTCKTLPTQGQVEPTSQIPCQRRSMQIADTYGVKLLAAIMRRSQKYPANADSEGPWMSFVPVIAFLPRTAAAKILRKYERSGSSSERLWAGEYLKEFEMSDTNEMVRSLRAQKQ